MCEFTSWSNKRKALSFFKHTQIDDWNIHGLSERFPYALQEARCPKCGRYLEDFERRPPGRATRSMCLGDYEYWVSNNISYECFVCSRSLPDEKIYSQDRNNRELKHHIHDGDCTYIWTIIHNVSVGEPDIVRRFGKKSKQIVTIELSGHSNWMDDATTTGRLLGRYRDQLPRPSHTPKALPYLAQQPRIPIQKIYNGKPVKAVSVKLVR